MSDWPATEYSPDHSTCRFCGQPISWDEISYTHDANGFSTCGTIVSGGKKPRGVIAKALEAVGAVGVVDPVIEVDPAWLGKRAEPITWNEERKT